MPAYAALLRGVNLGRNRISMADLRALVEALGAGDVRTYVQSGNVVFSSGLSPAQLEQRLAESLRQSVGLDVAVLVRTAGELAELVAGNPFLASGADAATLHVTFLAAEPAADLVRGLHERSFGAEELRVVGRAVYLRCPKGYGRTKLSNAFLERQLAVPATTRNWRTVEALAELSKGS
jgi:uncharacterized protein (DUF1697 family)